MEQWDYLYNRTMGLSISYNDYNVKKQKRLNCFKNELFMEIFMNGHFKSERAKIVLCLFLTKVNIWKFSGIMLMNFSHGYVITVI